MDFMCPTGFGTVSHNVLDRLTPYFKEENIEVDVCALNYGDRPHTRYNDQIMIVNPKEFAKNKDDVYFRDGFLKILQLGDYDVVWIMNDIPVIAPMGKHLKFLCQEKIAKKTKPFKLLFYTPIDSKPSSKFFKDFDWFDSLVTYTNYGRKQIMSAFKNENPQKDIQIDIINHGMDTINFKPLNNKEDLRLKYSLPIDAFIWGNINKNQPRKDIGGTLISFMYFKEAIQKKYPNKKVVLYLHCYHSDPTGIKIFDVIEKLGLKFGEDVFLPIEEKYVNGDYSVQDMNEVYNCLDAFVNTTMAEGWGLSLTEAMSVGLPIVAGLHTSFDEITDYGKLIYAVDEMIEHIQIHDGENIRYKLSPQAVCLQMVSVHKDVDKKINYAEKYAHKIKDYDWDLISNQFKKQIQKLIL